MSDTEHLIMLVNSEDKQARVAALRVQGTKQQALAVAASHGFQNFNLDEITDSADGYSKQRVAKVRGGQLL